MDTSAILDTLKVDLQISTTAYDTLLTRYITEAVQAIRREGITLAVTSGEGEPVAYSIEDGVLVERYAAYLFRSRDQNTGMPRSLRYLLNNRLFSEKGKVDE